MKLKWKKIPHRIWGKGGKEENIHKLKLSFTFPRWQWLTERFSIVGKGSVLWIGEGEVYELYDLKNHEVVGHYKTLKKAQQIAETL